MDESSNYLRVKLTLRSWGPVNNGKINLSLQASLPEKVEQSRTFIPGGGELTIAIAAESDFAKNLRAGRTFYCDLVPTEAAQAAGHV